MPASAAFTDGLPFRHVTLIDFEFQAHDGERPVPICLVAHELFTGRTHRIWEDELQSMRSPPFPTGSDAVVVCYYASAEASCYLGLSWPMPEHVIDLFAEFRNWTNGTHLTCGNGLLGALAYFGLDSISVAEKDAMRALAIRGAPWADGEPEALLAYCGNDVDAQVRLWDAMRAGLDVPRAVLRGRFMLAAARIESNGVPIDVRALAQMREHWDAIKDRLIARIDREYGVFEGRVFKAVRWEQWLAKAGIPWPRLPSGALQLDDDTFREMARMHSGVARMRELRHLLSQLRLADLAVGSDGRNRCMLSAFRARTGRNQPSNSRFIFGPSVWLRSLIKPTEGNGLAYVDWSQQEWGIAAALSGDRAMLDAYTSGDPYLAFAKQAGAVPAWATKETHGPIRDQYKACALATMYGQGAESFARRVDLTVPEARALLEAHRRTYSTFWAWSDAAVDHAMLHGWLHTVFGWRVHATGDVNPRFLRNFLVQGNGAELLRLACCLMTERGIKVCAPVHDAVLIEAPLGELDDAVAAAQAAMEEASEIVLGGFRLRSDVKTVRFPDRYRDPRGEKMWDEVQRIVAELERGEH